MGDLLPSTLYISYLRMLKGLSNGPQCAHYCFSLLKTNGATHSKIHCYFKLTFFISSPTLNEHLMIYFQSFPGGLLIRIMLCLAKKKVIF